jgi:hypothetical protein
VKPDDMLAALQDLTARERIEFLAAGPVAAGLSSYLPIAKYLLDLKNGSKPETAAEDLFSALCKDLLGFLPTRQVGLTEGYVDFMLPDPTGQPVPIELKLLFQCYGTEISSARNETPGVAVCKRTGSHITCSLPKPENTRNH